MSQEVGRRLDGIELLSSLSANEKQQLEKQCRWRRFAPGEQILDKDSGDRDVYFVASGSLQVVNYSMTGREISLAKVTAGSYFGELSAIDGRPRSASVVALEECLLGSLAPTLFFEQIDRHPDIAKMILRRLASIVRSCDERIMDLSTLGAVQRVYLHVLRMSEESPTNPGNWVIRSMPTQKSIAADASTTRETVARSISQLNAAGIIERRGRVVYIRDREKLERLAGALGVGEQDLSR